MKLAREYQMKSVIFALWDFGRVCWVMPRQHLRALSSDLLRDLRDEATAAQSNTAAQACQRHPDPIRWRFETIFDEVFLNGKALGNMLH